MLYLYLTILTNIVSNDENLDMSERWGLYNQVPASTFGITWWRDTGHTADGQNVKANQIYLSGFAGHAGITAPTYEADMTYAHDFLNNAPHFQPHGSDQYVRIKFTGTIGLRYIMNFNPTKNQFLGNMYNNKCEFKNSAGEWVEFDSFPSTSQLPALQTGFCYKNNYDSNGVDCLSENGYADLPTDVECNTEYACPDNDAYTWLQANGATSGFPSNINGDFEDPFTTHKQGPYANVFSICGPIGDSTLIYTDEIKVTWLADRVRDGYSTTYYDNWVYGWPVVIAKAAPTEPVTASLDSLYGGGGGGASTQGDPHIRFAHGGVADLRGKNNTYVSLLSVPGFQFSAKTMDTDFLLPRPQLIHGSFFTDVGFRFRGRSGREYGVTSSASKVAFDVFDVKSGSLIHALSGIWKQWWEDGVRVYYKQATIFVRAHGWEVNATRHPIYNHVSGPSKWRFDFAMRYLDGTGFDKLHGNQSKTCFPHGIIGQSWDGDKLGVDGKIDDYTYSRDNSVVTTSANAEGGIEGTLNDYLLKGPWDKDNFQYSRYDKAASDVCKPRDARILKGKKHFSTSTSSVATSTDLLDD